MSDETIKNLNAEIDQNIELLFFDPYKSRDEYIEYYKSCHLERFTRENGRYRYSPLFLLLKDTHYCYGIGKEFNPVRGDLHFPEFAGIILVRIAFTNTIKRFYYGGLNKFASQFMSIHDPEELDALELLRNAIEHSYYSLHTYVGKGETRKKIYFSLSHEFADIIKKVDNWKTSYPSEMYNVNPRLLFTSFENGLLKLKAILLDHTQAKLRLNFHKSLDIDQWIVTGP